MSTLQERIHIHMDQEKAIYNAVIAGAEPPKCFTCPSAATVVSKNITPAGYHAWQCDQHTPRTPEKLWGSDPGWPTEYETLSEARERVTAARIPKCEECKSSDPEAFGHWDFCSQNNEEPVKPSNKHFHNCIQCESKVKCETDPCGRPQWLQHCGMHTYYTADAEEVHRAVANCGNEKEIRERCAKVVNAAQVSRSHAFLDIPFLLGELDSIDLLLARRSALDGLTSRFAKIAFMLECLREPEGIKLLDRVRARQSNTHGEAQGKNNHPQPANAAFPCKYCSTEKPA